MLLESVTIVRSSRDSLLSSPVFLPQVRSLADLCVLLAQWFGQIMKLRILVRSRSHHQMCCCLKTNHVIIRRPKLSQVHCGLDTIFYLAQLR